MILNSYKLILQGSAVSPAGHPGPVYPNASSHLSAVDSPSLSLDCGGGCLFNVVDDPTEHRDSAADEPEVLERLVRELGGLEPYENRDELEMECEGGDVGEEVNCGCHLAVEKWGGYYGPYATG